MARGAARDARRRRHPRRARPLVPRGGDDRGARARPRPVASTSRASGTSGAASRPRGPSTPRAAPPATPRRSPARAVRRALRRQGDQGAARRSRSSSQIDRLKAGLVEARPRRRATLGFEFLHPKRSGRVVIEAEGLALRGGRQGAARGRRRFALERGEHVSLVGAERLAARRRCSRRCSAGASPAAGTGQARPRRRGRLLLPARGRARRARLGARGGDRGDRACAAPRRRSSSAGSSSRAGRSTRSRSTRALGRRAAAARAGARRRERRQPARPRRADQPPRPREPRGARGRAARRSPARCCSSPTTARSSTPSPGGCSRSRPARSSPTPGGWAEYLRRRDEPRRAAAGAARRAGDAEAGRAQPPPAPTRSSCVEREIARDRGARRRARAPARRGLDERRPRRRPPRRARRARGAARALGAAVRGGGSRPEAGGAQRSSGAIVSPKPASWAW